MKRSVIFRLALRTVPRSWRDTVERDLVDEAQRLKKGAVWCAAQAVGAGFRLRPSITGDAWRSDIKYASRSLVQSPWFTIGAVLTFALGIGVNVAVFSAVDRMLFRHLPYAHPEQLGILGQYTGTMDRPYGTLPLAYIVGARQLDGVADASSAGWNGYDYYSTAEPGDETPILLTEAAYNLLSVLGVHPAYGHDFTKEDAAAHRAQILLGYQTWQTRFGGQRDAIGKRLWSNSKPAEIVGILPPDFIQASYFLDPKSQGLLLDFDTLDHATAADRGTPPAVRLKPGVSFAVAQAQIDAMVARLKTEQPAPRSGAAQVLVKLTPLDKMLFGTYRTYLLLIAAAAALVLLVACANLSSLMLVRARSRERHTAIAIALGASRARVIRSLLVESVLLSLAGGTVAAIALLLAHGALNRALPPVFSRYSAGYGDFRVLAVFIGVAALGALLTAILPGWRASRVDVLPALQQTGGLGRSRRVGGGSLLAIEAALGILLVAGAASTGRTLLRLVTRDLGFEERGLYSVRVSLPLDKDTTVRFEQYSRALGALREVPGLKSVGAADYSPLSGALTEPMSAEYARRAQAYQVEEGFLPALGVRTIAGRTFTADEIRSRAPVGVLSVNAAELIWPGERVGDVVGRTFSGTGRPATQIIGIVGDVRASYTSSPWPSLYLPLSAEKFRFMDYVVRTSNGEPPSIVDMRAHVKSAGLSPTGVSYNAVTKRLSDSLLNYRFRAVLFGAFGFTALLLAAIGLYAVSSFEVSLRRREMGVRLSLGATPRRVIRLVLADAVRPVVIGALIGLGLTYWAAQYLQSFLTMVDARDPGTFAIVVAVLLAAAVGAAWIPARRAARTDPSVVLRSQ